MSLCCPRPGYKRAYLAYKLGTPPPRGYPVLSFHLVVYRRPLRRSWYRLGRGSLHYLAVRRRHAATCRRRGFVRVGHGVWLDPSTEVGYAVLKLKGVI